MIKITLALMMVCNIYAGSNWNYNVLAQKGWKIEIICKNGYLVELFLLPNGGKFEESHCYDKSAWDGECNHPPIKCDSNTTLNK